MKRLLTLLALVLCSCAETFVGEEIARSNGENLPDLTAAFAEDETRTYVENDKYLRWHEDDRLTAFYGTTLNRQYKFNGATGDNSGTFSLVPSGELGTGNTFDHIYAVYPYNETATITDAGEISLTLPAVQTYAENSFGRGANTMIAVTENLEDTFLAFKNACGYLKLKLYNAEGATIKSIEVKGNNGEKLAGAATATIAFGEAPQLTIAEAATTSVTLDCGDGVALGTTAETATEFWIVLPTTTFADGLTITVVYTNGGSFEKSTSNEVIIERNAIQPMATFELPPKPIDLAMNGTANCYIISSAGNYVFPAVQGNSSIFIESISSVEILWESFGDAKTPNIGDLIKSVSYRNGYVELSTSDKYTEGNAVVAVKKDDGTILWSWHIWLTDYPDEQLYYNNTKGMMDRNLGATSDTRVDIHSLGLFYQWGRKDPFLGPGKITSVQKAASTYHWPTPEESTKETGTIEYTISHPTTFITGNRFNNDWYFTGSKSSDSSRWSYKKTIYDPCPAGWKLPSMSVWTNVWGVNTKDNGYDAYYNDAILAHWVGGDYGNILEPDNQLGEYESIWYPFTGCLNGDTGDIVSSDRWNGIWSYNSTTDHIVGFMCGRFAHTGDASYAYGVGYTYIAKNGLSVRCVKE